MAGAPPDLALPPVTPIGEMPLISRTPFNGTGMLTGGPTGDAPLIPIGAQIWRAVTMTRAMPPTWLAQLCAPIPLPVSLIGTTPLF